MISESVANQSCVVMIAAGGTGGHVYPALAVCEKLLKLNVPIIWVGTGKGLESKVVPNKGIPISYIEVAGFRGKSLAQKVKVPFLLLGSIGKVRALIKEHRVTVVLGFGGYVAAAVGLASLIARKPLLLQEQNAIAGTSNRLLARFARKIFTGFPNVFRQRKNAVYSGNPLREELLSEISERADDRKGGDSKVVRSTKIAVIGGSLGSRPINEIVPGALSVLAKMLKEGEFVASEKVLSPVSILHQTGRGNLQAVASQYEQSAVSEAEMFQVDTVEFIEEMHVVLSEVDLVVARAGAMTVSELLALGIPSILVPLPHAIDDHQQKNAEFAVENGAAKLMRQCDMTEESLASMLYGLIVEPERLDEMSSAAMRASKPGASALIANSCLEFVA